MDKSAVQIANQSAVVGADNQVIPRKSKTRTENQMTYLPEEIIFKIFLLLPAKDLLEVMKLVCRTWRRLISDPVFTKEHYSQSTDKSPYGILKFDDYFEIYSINKDGTTWNLTRRINQTYISNAVGLILTGDRVDPSLINLLNPITKQILTLPVLLPNVHRYSKSWAVGYSQSTSIYKVMYRDTRRIYILTVGVDKQWREIVDPMTALIHWEAIHSLEKWGFMYWHIPHKRCLILFDLGKEIFYKVDFLETSKGGQMKGAAIPIPSDRFLSIGIYNSKLRQWNFWDLVDFKNAGEWHKFGSINLKDRLSDWNKIVGLPSEAKNAKRHPPVAIMNDEVIFQHGDCNFFFAYNFKKGTLSRLFDNIPKGLKLMFSNSLVDLLPDHAN